MRQPLAHLLALSLLGASPLTAQCIGIGAFSTRGNVPGNLVPAGSATAISGMVASRHNPDIIWLHDDGDVGHLPQLFAVRPDGSVAQRYLLTGVTNRDWEEITLGPGPIPGRDYLYIAETGNNAFTFTSLALLRVPEPDVPVTAGATINLAAETFAFRYPTGTFNCETLWIDPADGAPWFLTKENATTCSLFRYPLPLDTSVEKALVRERALTGMPRSFTGGAVSQDGRVVLARTTGAVYAWPRALGAPFATTFDAPPCSTLTTAQGQAEAITLSADGRTLWAVSEGSGAALRSAPVTFPAGVPVAYKFGSGLAAGGVFCGLGSTAAPRLAGAPVSLGVWQAAPTAPAALLMSVTGLPDGAAPFAGGWLHALPDLALLLAIDAAGSARQTLPALPDHPVLYGVAWHAQVLVADPAAPQGIALSAGLRLVLDR